VHLITVLFFNPLDFWFINRFTLSQRDFACIRDLQFVRDLPKYFLTGFSDSLNDGPSPPFEKDGAPFRFFLWFFGIFVYERGIAPETNPRGFG